MACTVFPPPYGYHRHVRVSKATEPAPVASWRVRWILQSVGVMFRRKAKRESQQTNKGSRLHPSVADRKQIGDANDNDRNDQARATTAEDAADDVSSTASCPSVACSAAQIGPMSNKNKERARRTPVFLRRLSSRKLSGGDEDAVDDIESTAGPSTRSLRSFGDLFGEERQWISPGTTPPPSSPLSATSSATPVGRRRSFQFSVPSLRRRRQSHSPTRWASSLRLSRSPSILDGAGSDPSVFSKFERDVEIPFAWGQMQQAGPPHDVACATSERGREDHKNQTGYLDPAPADPTQIDCVEEVRRDYLCMSNK